jgi:hypothetical protein
MRAKQRRNRALCLGFSLDQAPVKHLALKK